MVQAIILAAGMGQRMMPLTQDKPKCLISFKGKTLFQRQIEALKDSGISNIKVVGGHGAHHFPSSVPVYPNDHFTKTNMAYSLFDTGCIDPHQDLLVVYGDCLYQRTNIQNVLQSPHAIALSIDTDWLSLWRMRFDDPLNDCETLMWENHRITEIGQKPLSLETIQGQYTGLFILRTSVLSEVISLYNGLKERPNLPRSFKNLFLTDVLQFLINDGYPVYGVPTHRGWIEFDSITDFELYERLYDTHHLKDFYDETL